LLPTRFLICDTRKTTLVFVFYKSFWLATANGPGCFHQTAHILVCIANDPALRLRDIGDRVGITERAAHRVVSELAVGGLHTRTRAGRRNSYKINTTAALADPIARQPTTRRRAARPLDPQAARALTRRKTARPAKRNKQFTPDGASLDSRLKASSRLPNVSGALIARRQCCVNRPLTITTAQKEQPIRDRSAPPAARRARSRTGSAPAPARPPRSSMRAKGPAGPPFSSYDPPGGCRTGPQGSPKRLAHGDRTETGDWRPLTNLQLTRPPVPATPAAADRLRARQPQLRPGRRCRRAGSSASSSASSGVPKRRSRSTTTWSRGTQTPPSPRSASTLLARCSARALPSSRSGAPRRRSRSSTTS